MKALAPRRPVSLAAFRMAFVVLALLSSGGLTILAVLVEQRLAQAREDRAEMVAQRVFDELEREASVFLDVENQRPPYRELSKVESEGWAPFVVGYFKLNESELEVARADGDRAQHERRVRWAIEQARKLDRLPAARTKPFEPAEAEAPAPSAPPQRRAFVAPQEAREPEALPEPQQGQQNQSIDKRRKSDVTEAEILRNLNRAPERRKPVKQKSPEPSSQQFQDYAEQF